MAIFGDALISRRQMEQLNLIPEEVVTELKNHKNAKLPDNTLKMLQILASLDTPKELLATLLDISENYLTFTMTAFEEMKVKCKDTQIIR